MSLQSAALKYKIKTFVSRVLLHSLGSFNILSAFLLFFDWYKVIQIILLLYVMYYCI